MRIACCDDIADRDELIITTRPDLACLLRGGEAETRGPADRELSSYGNPPVLPTTCQDIASPPLMCFLMCFDTVRRFLPPDQSGIAGIGNQSEEQYISPPLHSALEQR